MPYEETHQPEEAPAGAVRRSRRSDGWLLDGRTSFFGGPDSSEHGRLQQSVQSPLEVPPRRTPAEEGSLLSATQRERRLNRRAKRTRRVHLWDPRRRTTRRGARSCQCIWDWICRNEVLASHDTQRQPRRPARPRPIAATRTGRTRRSPRTGRGGYARAGLGRRNVAIPDVPSARGSDRKRKAVSA